MVPQDAYLDWTDEDAERESLDAAEPCSHKETDHYLDEICAGCGERVSRQRIRHGAWSE